MQKQLEQKLAQRIAAVNCAQSVRAALRLPTLTSSAYSEVSPTKDSLRDASGLGAIPQRHAPAARDKGAPLTWADVAPARADAATITNLDPHFLFFFGGVFFLTLRKLTFRFILLGARGWCGERAAQSSFRALCARCGAMRVRTSPSCTGLGSALRDV
jgi:hypothetical protein